MSTFSDVEPAAREFQKLLSKTIVARLDWSTLGLYPGTFVDERFAQHQTDLLFSVEMVDSLGGTRAYIHVVFERRASVEALMPFWILSNMVRIWSKLLADQPDAKQLDVLVSLLIHRSDRLWPPTTRIEALFNLDANMRTAINAHVPRFSFLQQREDEEAFASLLAAADRLIERGRDGQLRGPREGRLRSLFLGFLGRRYGELPDAVVAQVLTATQEQLGLMCTKGFFLTSLAEVLDGTEIDWDALERRSSAEREQAQRTMVSDCATKS